MSGAAGLSFLMLFGHYCCAEILGNIKYKVLQWLFLHKFAKLEAIPLRGELFI